ncbi:DNA primase [soil metagenome]
MSHRIPRSFIDELLSRCDLVELINTRVPLRKSGSNYTACCPFHQEKTPSFSVNANKQFYHCFGCGVSGNAISFLIEYQHVSFVEAIEILANNLGLTIPQPEDASAQPEQHHHLYQLLQQAAQFYTTQLRQHPQRQIAIDYMKSRGLTGIIVKQFNIGYAPAGWDNLQQQLVTHPELQQQLITAGMLVKKEGGGCYDRFRNRIMFPIYDRRNRVIGFGGRALGDEQPKYLNSPETPLFHKSNELYGLTQALSVKPTEILIVEGYMDLVALAQYGITNVVATLGTATTVQHLKLLFRYCPLLVFCFDGDKAGRNAAWRALETALPLLKDGQQIRFMFLPEGEDPDSLIRKEGATQFNHRLSAAMPLSEYFFSTLSKSVDINSMDGKARLAQLATNHINKIPVGVFQQLMQKQLAEMLGMELQRLQSLNAVLKPPVTRSKQNGMTTPKRVPSPVRIAIALLLQTPTLIKYVETTEHWPNLPTPGVPLLLELVTVLRQNPQATTGALMEYWRDRKEAATIAKLAVWEHHVPATGIEEEFLGVLKRLRQRSQEQHVEKLLQKAGGEGLTDEERAILLQLLKNKADL